MGLAAEILPRKVRQLHYQANLAAPPRGPLWRISFVFYFAAGKTGAKGSNFLLLQNKRSTLLSSIDVAAKTKDSKMHVSCLSNITKRKQQDCLCLIQQSFYYFSDE